MWNRRSWRSKLEAALRGQRAEAPTGLVEDISRRISARPISPRRAWSRLAFASAVSVFVLGTFASFGGLSYAASGATGTASAVKQVFVKQTLTVRVHKSSAASQYPNTPTKPTTPHKSFTPPRLVKAPATTPSTVVSAKTLPFTGFSLLATFVASLFLIGLGVVLRRRERRN